MKNCQLILGRDSIRIQNCSLTIGLLFLILITPLLPHVAISKPIHAGGLLTQYHHTKQWLAQHPTGNRRYDSSQPA